MRIGSLLFSLFLFLSLNGQGNKEALLAEADLNIKNGKYDVALSKVNEVLISEPSDLQAIKMKINIKFLQNELKEALELVENTIDKVSGDDELIYLRGVINMGREKYEKAVSDFNIIIHRNTYPLMYKVYLNRGVANQYLLEYEMAASDYSKSIELNTENASAYHSRGMLNYQLKDYAAAVDDFKKSLKISENNPESQFNIGMCYFRMEETDKACVHFHNACKEGNLNACKMVMMECAKDLPK